VIQKPIPLAFPVVLSVKSIEQAREFYERVMGYQLERPDSSGYRLCKLELDRVSIELIEPPA
jgi:hypothetical protein